MKPGYFQLCKSLFHSVIRWRNNEDTTHSNVKIIKIEVSPRFELDSLDSRCKMNTIIHMYKTLKQYFVIYMFRF